MGETQSLLSRSSQPREGSREKRHHQTPPAPPARRQNWSLRAGHKGLLPDSHLQAKSAALPSPHPCSNWLNSDFPDLAIFRGGWEGLWDAEGFPAGLDASPGSLELINTLMHPTATY